MYRPGKYSRFRASEIASAPWVIEVLVAEEDSKLAEVEEAQVFGLD